jgi:hypothetical protein
MELLDKANIIAEVWGAFGEQEEWQDFFEYFDLGIPFAYGLANGFILDLSPDGEQSIEDTWDSLCTILGLDPQGEWEDTTSFLNSANYMEA